MSYEPPSPHDEVSSHYPTNPSNQPPQTYHPEPSNHQSAYHHDPSNHQHDSINRDSIPRDTPSQVAFNRLHLDQPADYHDSLGSPTSSELRAISFPHPTPPLSPSHHSHIRSTALQYPDVHRRHSTLSATHPTRATSALSVPLPASHTPRPSHSFVPTGQSEPRHSLSELVTSKPARRFKYRIKHTLPFEHLTHYLLSIGRARFSIPSFLAGCLVTAYIFRLDRIANTLKGYEPNIADINEIGINEVVQVDSLLSWYSPHLRDCNEVATIMTSDSNSKTLEMEDRFVHTNATLHAPSFLMSIHNPAKDSVSKSIYQNGCWECHHLRDMLSALRAHPSSYFLDVGGNIGMWTLAAAAANHQTFTLEPSRDNYERICETVNRNQFHDRIHLMTIAATSEPANFTLNVPRGNKGGTSVVAVGKSTTGTDTNSNGGITTIQGFPIDSLHLPLDRPVVMKVDVEGHELEALIGALEFLKSAKMVHVAMELRPMRACSSEDQQKWKRVFDVLTSNHGLAPYRVDASYDLFPLDPNNLSQWRHKKHAKVRFYDVVWKTI